jgi:SecD/SecF fusion protein
VAVIDHLLDPKVLESLKIFNVPPVVWVPLVGIAASIAVGYLLAKALRLKDFGWKFSLILAAWTASITVIVFGQFKLGADLRGGVNLVYEVNEKATALLNPEARGQYQLDAVVDVLRRRLNPSGVKELVIRKSGPKQIEIVVPEVDKAQIDLIKKLVVTGGALRFLIIAHNEGKDGQIIDAAKAQAASINAGIRGSNLVKDDEGTDIGIWMELAREDREGVNPQDLPFRYAPMHEDLIRDASTGELIQLTPAEEADRTRLAQVLSKRGIRNVEILLRLPDSPDLDVRGDDLAYASPSLEMGGWQINFRMKGEGIGKMSALTGQNLPKPDRFLAIIFDNELISAPVIQGHISEQGQITGRFTEQETRFMSEILKSGSMPVVMRQDPIAENLIGSILGWDTIVKGSWSVVIALLVVLVLVILYYRFAGLVAALALALNLLLTVAIMVIIRAPFTLPGLAGLVLTVGMSIDANVLIFERIREELSRGAAFRMALRNGFDRALSAIIDGNLTTFLTALVLYVIGTDQLRGFGVTLMLGNMISMFTAIFCARVIFDAGERTRLLTSLSMTQFLTNPRVDWVRLFVPMTVASGVLILIGLVATVSRGTGIFDIDLKGGTTVTVMLREQMSDAEVRAALAKQLGPLRHETTGGQVDYQVYEISLQGEPAHTVYKIDSSFEAVAELERNVQEALKDPKTGADRVRTYQVEYKLVLVEGAAAGAGAADETQGSAKPPVTKDSGENGGAAGEAKSCSQAEDESKSEETEAKAEEKKEKDQAADAASKKAETAAEEEKTQPAATTAKDDAADAKLKTDETKATETRAATPATESPPPGSQTTTVEVRFPGNPINAFALQEHIKKAAEAAIKQNPFVTVDNKAWNRQDNASFETWTVTMALSEENAKAVFAQLEKSMEGSPVWQNSSSVSGQVTLDMQLKALYAILVSLLGIAAYVWFRFQKLSWGIAAIASLLHDTLVMLAGIGASYYVASALGFLGIQEFKISLTVVAGFLTLIGYSINDTIVIFDRIREIRGKSTQMTKELINDSVNQTLSRTLLTGGLTLLVVVILYIWGGEGIHTFAFCMLIGVISGTYSTVFIAAPMLLWLMGTQTAIKEATKPTAIKEPVTTAGGRN